MGRDGIAGRLKRGGIWALLGKVMSIVLALLVNALLARLLPAAEMGAYLTVLSLLAVAVVVTQFGLNQSTVKLLAEARLRDDPAVLAAVARRLLVMAVAAALAGAAALHGLLGLFPDALPAVQPHRAELAAWLFALSLGGVLAESFRGLHDIRNASLFGGILASSLLLLLLLVAWFAPGATTLADAIRYSLWAAAASMAVAAAVALRRHPALLRPGLAGAPDVRAVLRLTLPVWAVSLLGVVLAMAQVDLIMLGLASNGEQVALYGSAARLVLLVMMSLVIVNSVVSPLIAELNAQGRLQELERMLRRTAALAALPSLLALLVMIFCGKWVLVMIYGEYYGAAAGVLAVLALGQVANVYAGSCNMVLVMTGHQRVALRINLACAVVVLPAFYLAATAGGAFGLALVMAATLVARNLSLLFAVRRHLGIWVHADLPALWRERARLRDLAG